MVGGVAKRLRSLIPATPGACVVSVHLSCIAVTVHVVAIARVRVVTVLITTRAVTGRRCCSRERKGG